MILNDLDLNFVQKQIAGPFRTTKDFSYCGLVINTSSIEHIQLVQTETSCNELSDHVLQQGKKMDMTFGMNKRHDPFFRGAGVDYTNELLFLETKMPQPSTDFVIVTALEEEFEAVRALLPNCKKLPPSEHDTRVFFQSNIDVEFSDASKGTYTIALLCLHGMGRVEAANASNDAIRRFSPRYIWLVGIAGGICKNGAALGDVLISSQVVDYELQKVRAEHSEFRFTSHNADPRLLNEANHYRVDDCLHMLTAPRPVDGSPKKLAGAIATGDKVVADKEFLSEFLKAYPKSVGVEMESGGVASAAFKLPRQPGFFMVRAVSDLADEDKDSADTTSWRSHACALAAAYAIGLLKSGPVPLGATATGSTSDTKNSIAEDTEMTAAKRELLLYALYHDNLLQTVLSISQCPFAVALGHERFYKSEEEVLLFIEALKQLLAEGYLDGYFERASKNYLLTFNGLKVAKRFESESSDSCRKTTKRQQQTASEVADLAAKCQEALESIRESLAEASDRISLLNNLAPGICRTSRQNPFVIHFYHPNFGCSIQFRFFGRPTAGEDPGLRLLFTGDRIYDLKPYLLGSEIAWFGKDDREIGGAKAVADFILGLITDRAFVNNLPKAPKDD